MKKTYLGFLLVWLGLFAACSAQPTPNNTPLPAQTPSSQPPTQNSTPAALATVTGVSSAASAHPNILFILTDDQAIGDDAYMPQLAALITSQGVSFSDFFVSNSLCCPSRTTILRGQYSHNTKIYNNSPGTGGFQKFYALQEENATIATWLHAAGYRTGLVGKYLNGYPVTASETYIPPGWDEFDTPTNEAAYGEFNYSLNINGKVVAYNAKPEDYGTDVYGKYASSFITKSVQDHVPFFLFLTPFAPHLPATPAPQDLALFPNIQAPRSPSFNEPDVSDKPAFVSSRPLLTPSDITALDNVYRLRLQSLQAVDRMIAALVKQLGDSGVLDNTYIFFASDNGFHLGQHRLKPGKSTAYEEDIHVPLMVRGPGIPQGQIVSQLAVNTDLAPTWLELAGVPTPHTVDGRSLVPLLRDPSAALTWRQMISLEYGVPPKNIKTPKQPRATPAPITPSAAPTDATVQGIQEPTDPFDDNNSGESKARKLLAYRGFRTNDYTFVRYANGELELYDLRADPNELQNIAKSVSTSFLMTLQKQLDALGACMGITCSQIENNAPPPLEAGKTSLASPTP